MIIHPLEFYRRRAGLDIPQLAKLAGVSETTIRNIERGRITYPSGLVLEKLTATLGLSVHEFYGQIEVRHNEQSN